jgi:hypothetical protein
MLTVEDIKEELSYAYLHALAASVGCSCDRPFKDRDSCDVVVKARGYLAKDSVIPSPGPDIQMKATVRDIPAKGPIAYSLKIKNYHDLRRERTQHPQLLVVQLLPKDEQLWLAHDIHMQITRTCAFWCNLKGQPDCTNRKTRTVHIPPTNVFSPEVLWEMLLRVSREEEIGYGL